MEPESAVQNSQQPFSKMSVRFRGLCVWFVTCLSFYGEELLAPRPTPKLEDHPSLAVRDCSFNICLATLHIWRPFLHPKPEDASHRGDIIHNLLNKIHFSIYHRGACYKSYGVMEVQLHALLISALEEV
jgi:hypothetical protein